MLDDLYVLSRQFLAAKNQEYRRYFIKNMDLSHRMNIIIGARGVGKTTTLVQKLLGSVAGDLNSSKIIYIQADHFLMKSLSLYEVVEQFVQQGGEYLAIDEIHKYPEWSMELKSIFDTFDSLKIIASGSSALEISKGSHDLSRRALVFKMQGMSFREFLEMKYGLTLNSYELSNLLETHVQISHELVKQLNGKKTKVLKEFNEYLQLGYYPYSFDLNTVGHYQIALEQNIHVTLESDLTAIYPELTGRSIAKVKNLLSYIADHVPFVPSWSKIREVLEIRDSRTIKQYFQYLEDADLVLVLGPNTEKFKVLEAQGKVFLNNSNLIYALALSDPKIGTVRETFFANALSEGYRVSTASKGDFAIDGKYIFEIGGRKKSFAQVAGETNAFIGADNIEHGSGSKIPLWVFGLLY